MARAKYNAWAGLKGTPREAAKARYVQLLEGLEDTAVEVDEVR